ncbi:MAG: glycosyltransferase family 4 protein [Rikenellaceae bacterium]
MKILHITNNFSEGGVESLLMDILPLLVCQGYTIDLLVLNQNEIKLCESISKLGVNIIIGSHSSCYHPLNILLINSTIKKGNYDIVHSHLFPTQYYTIFANCITKTRSTKFITTEHTSVNNRQNYKLFSLIDRFIFNRYDKIIAVSPFIKDKLKLWSNTDSVVIPNGISLKRFDANREYPLNRSELKIPKSATIAIMVARFVSGKNQALVIEAISKIPNLYLILVGTGTTLDSCKSLANQLNITNRVKFVGYSSEPEKFINISDICILSTNHEGFGISVVECMAMQKPTIVSDIKILRDLFQDSILYAKPHSVDSLCNQIMSLINDKEYSKEMGNKALKQAQLFSITATVDNLIKLYKKLSLKNE